jgi:large subunit ribosomal protein L4
MQTKLYSLKSTKAGEIALPKEYGEKVNPLLLAQAIRVYEVNMHPELARAKTRAEVTISTRKIYKQKGTGGARHGAKSAPIFVGGGVAHGPKGVKRTLSLPKAMKRKALNIALSYKLNQKELVVADGFNKVTKTKEAAGLINKILADNQEASRVLLVFTALSEAGKKFFRNIKNVSIVNLKDINAYNIFYGGLIVLDSAMFEKAKTEKKEAKKIIDRKVKTVKKNKK